MDLSLRSNENKIQLWLFLSLLGSSLEPVLVKYFSPNVSPLSLIVLKSLVAGLLIIPFYGRFRKLGKPTYLPLFQVSALAFVTNGLIFLALQTIPATTLITIITVTPLLVALLNHKRGKARLTLQFVLAFLAVFIGVILTLEVLYKDASFSLNLGIGVALLSVITSALYRLKMDTLTNEINPFTVSVALFVFNGLTSLLILPFTDIPKEAIPFGIWLGLAGVVANISFLYAIKHLGSTRVSILSVMQRPIAVVFGAILLKEIISEIQVLGMFLIFVGKYFARMKPVAVKSQG